MLSVSDNKNLSQGVSDLQYEGAHALICQAHDNLGVVALLVCVVRGTSTRGSTMTTYANGTPVIRTRHIHAASIFGALLLWLGVTVSLTFVGLIVGIPMAIAGLGLVTTPHPH